MDKKYHYKKAKAKISIDKIKENYPTDPVEFYYVTDAEYK